MNPLERKSGYVKRVFKLPDYAKELRVTHVAEKLFEMHDDTTEEKKKTISAYGKKFALLCLMVKQVNGETMYSIVIGMPRCFSFAFQ